MQSSYLISHAAKAIISSQPPTITFQLWPIAILDRPSGGAKMWYCCCQKLAAAASKLLQLAAKKLFRSLTRSDFHNFCGLAFSPSQRIVLVSYSQLSSSLFPAYVLCRMPIEMKKQSRAASTTLLTHFLQQPSSFRCVRAMVLFYPELLLPQLS